MCDLSACDKRRLELLEVENTMLREFVDFCQRNGVALMDRSGQKRHLLGDAWREYNDLRHCYEYLCGSIKRHLHVSVEPAIRRLLELANMPIKDTQEHDNEL